MLATLYVTLCLYISSLCSTFPRKVYRRGSETMLRTMFVCLAVVVMHYREQSPAPSGATTPGIAEASFQTDLLRDDSFPGLGLQRLSVWGVLGMLGQEEMVSLPAGGGCWQRISVAK